MIQSLDILFKLVKKVIADQFPEYAHLSITSVEKQGHDNRTFRLGKNMLIRMPSAEEYALRVCMEHQILLKFASRLPIQIPVPIKRGEPSKDYPFPFSIYKWLPGKSINLLILSSEEIMQLAFDYELCQIRDKNSDEAEIQKKIINEALK